MDPRFVPPPAETSTTAPRRALTQLAKLTLGMLCLSQLLAGGIYLGLHWRQQLFIAGAHRTEAKVVSITPDVRGYSVLLEYKTGALRHRAAAKLHNPPAAAPGAILIVYVNPRNHFEVEIPGEPKVALAFLQLACAGFALFFSLFIGLGMLATSTLLANPQVVAEMARLRAQIEKHGPLAPPGADDKAA